MKNPWKDLWIKGREIERLAFWESLGLFLSVTIISDLENDGLLCDYNWQLCKSTALQVNTLVHGQSMDILRTEHGCSADRARTFRGQSTDVPWTQQGYSVACCAAIHWNPQPKSSAFVGFV